MDGWRVFGYLFIYFWAVYCGLHIIMICRTLCCENDTTIPNYVRQLQYYYEYKYL